MYSHASINRLYRLVWNEALMIWMAVAETARGRGKSGTGKRRTAALMALSANLFVLPPAMAGPNNIRPDGRTQTTVSTSGGATHVNTSTTSGANAFNSFTNFGVGAGQVVNLHVPGQSANLINIVTGPSVTVDGILNSIKNNQVGGNVFFASPQGFVVGTQGVVNVGSLTVSTPTNAFVTDFFASPGTPVEASLSALLSGTAPGNASGRIAINGVINASGSVSLKGGSVGVSGSINRGARFVHATSDFTDVVNANGLEQGTKVVEIDGRMVIVADTDSESGSTGAEETPPASTSASAPAPAPAPATGSVAGAGGATPPTETVAAQTVDADNRIDISADTDVDVSGTLSAMGSAGVTGGTVNIQAGNDVSLQNGARILTSGQGANSSGGVVNIFAANTAVAQTGALVDSSAGTSGRGGAIEFSAKKTVELAGGEFRATATDGARGSVLIDPENITVTSDQYFGGADHTLIAENNITVSDGVVVSTRNVVGGGGADQVAATSAGDSGHLTIQAGSINLGAGTKLVSFAEAGSLYSGGDISLIAGRTSGGSAEISASGSVIKGNNVSINAQSSYDDTGAVVPSPLNLPTVSSKVDLNNTEVSATGSLTVSSKSTINTSTASASPIGTVVASSEATIDVRGSSSVTTGADAQLSAESQVTAKVKPAGSTTSVLPADAGVAINTISSTATVKVGDTANINSGGELALEAKNKVDAETVADVSAGDPAAVGGTVAVTEVTTVTKASVEDTSTTQSASLKVLAESENTMVTTAKAAAKGATKKGASASKTEEQLGKYEDEASTSEGSVDVAAAVAIVSLNSSTQAAILSSGLQSSSGAASVTSAASNSSTVTADGSTVGDGADVGVGAAVGVNIGVLNNSAEVGEGADVSVNGLTVKAEIPVGKENQFNTTATSGAGAANVGVAGALGVNTVVSQTSAVVKGEGGLGARVNAGTGDVLIEAGNASSSSVTVGAEVAGTGGSAKVGVGASVGVNVVSNKTVAEVADNVLLTGGANMGLDAKSAHTMSTTVEGGAAGAGVAVTPVVAVSIGDNATIARLGASTTGVGISGAYSSTADQSSAQTTVAKGQTEGSDVSVGASLALGIADDTVLASVERNVTADNGVGVNAKSVSKSDTSATASVKGGKKADENGEAEAGESVNEQVAVQGDSAKDKGKKTADKAGAAPTTTGGSASDKLDKNANPTGDEAPKAETSEGGVSVAAAVGINVADAKAKVSIADGIAIDGGTGALSVTSLAETDAAAKADGSQTDAGGTDVGVGAAVAVNAVTASNVATVGDNAIVNSSGLTVKAGMTDAAAKNDFVAESKSGAGAGNVGVAGSLAINTVVNTTVANLQSDTDLGGTGASVDANGGDILIEADNASTSTVTADAKVTGTGGSAKVGVGASVGVNVVSNKTVAEVADKAVLTGGANLGLNASASHAMSTDVTGGAAGAKTSVTPVVAVSIGDNTTIARLGESATGVNIGGVYSSAADQSSTQTTKATGQTEGSDVSVGASLALGIADDTVLASVERNITAVNGVSVNAKSVSKSDTSATASVKGGKKADENGDAEAGESVNEQVAKQGDSAKDTGNKTAVKAEAAGPAPTTTGGAASDKLDTTKADNKTAQQAPKAETSEGGVSVAAAVGINVADSSAKASIEEGVTINGGTGALSVTSLAETDAAAKADGSQTDAGGTDVGVGAAVAVNAVTASNVASVGDNASVTSQGLTVKAAMADAAAKNDFAADAKAGAGAADVGVAGALAINVVNNTSTAGLSGDADNSGTGASVNAGSGDVLIEAGNTSTSTVKAAADVKGTGTDAKVGVGASVGVNVAVNKTVAEVADKAVLTGGRNLGLNASADHAMTTELVGGAAGAKTSITPVVAVAIGVNTTQARMGDSSTGLSLSGAYSSTANQKNAMTTKATAQAEGDTAVGASLAAAIAVDDVSAELRRDIDSSTGVELIAQSDTSLTTETTAGAKGAKQAKKNATTGKEEPEAGTTVDEQKKNQLDFAKGKNAGAASVDTDTQEAKTPDTSTATPGTDKPTAASEQNRKGDKGKKISVAAAIGVGVARNKSRAEIGENLSINAGAGNLKIGAQSDTNYTTKSSGEAVSDDTGVGVAVSITATNNATEAILGAGTTVSQAGDVNVSAESHQNRGAGFESAMSAEAVSGASGGDTAVAGSLALVVNENTTLASIDEGATLGSASDVGNVSVTAQDTSKISALARAGSKSTGSGSKTGVGASFAVLVSQNENQAVIGRDADKNGSFDATAVNAESVTVSAAKNRVSTPATKNLSVDDVKNLDFNTFKPSDYLASNNYYTEAIAGAAAKGDTAVAGAFAVNVFTNKNIAELGDSVSVTTSGSHTSSGETLGVEITSLSDTQSMSIAGAAAGAKKTGVGISNADTVNLDETRAEIGKGSSVTSTGTDAGVKVSAESLQEMTNVGVSAGASTSGTAVAGVLGVVVALGKTEARVDDDAAVKARGDVSVKARTDTTGVMVSGGVAASGETGVGASIAAQVVANATEAAIGKNAIVSSAKQLVVDAEASEDITSAVVAGAGAGTTAVAGALSVNVIVSDTKAMVEQGAQINTDATYSSVDQGVSITASDDTEILAITGGGAGGGTTGVGAALDTDVMAKTVTAGIANGAGTQVNAKKDVIIDASSSEDLTSVTVGFAGGGTTGVGGAVSVGVVKNDVHAMIGDSAKVDADGNVGVNAQDDITVVLAAGGLGGGGTTGVGGSIGVATLLGTTKATVGDNAEVNARGLGNARAVYSGETVAGSTSIAPADLGAKKTELAKGLSVTAYNREQLTTTVVSAGGGGTSGVAATVSADVIANTTEASIGRNARINETNGGAGADQEVRVKAIDETSLINSAGGAGGGGSAGVGAAANVGVIAKTTTAKIGKGSLVNATKAVEVEAASLDSTLSSTVGLAGGGSVGVGGALGGVGIANTTEATIEDGTSVADAARINVSAGDLSVKADEFANSWMVSGGAAAGGSAGVGASLSVAVNASNTKAKIGDFAETNASGTTSVQADSTESVNTVTVAGAAGGSAGVSGSIAVNVVTSHTEAGIGHDAKVNQTMAGQNVDVRATDRIESLAVAGAVAGGGAAGVGGTVAVTVAQNTTQAYIGDNTAVSASQDVNVNASSDKTVDSATVAGAAGGSAGVAGAVSIVAVGMLLDDESKDSLDSTSSTTDGQTTKSAVGNMLGSSAQSQQTKSDLDSQASKMAVSQPLSDSAVIPGQNTQARIGANAQVTAGRDVTVTASDKTASLTASGGAAGGGAAGVAGAASVVLLRDSAAATIADGATVNAGRTLNVNAETAESIFNVGLAAAGGGAAGVNGSAAINVVSSETVAAIGNAQINQAPSATGTRSVLVGAQSDSEMITVAGSGGAAGAAAVGGVVNVNTLSKSTTAHIAEGANVNADQNVRVQADSQQAIIGASVSVQAGGAAGVGGAVAVNVIDNNTEAFIGSQWNDASKTAARVDSSGNVVIAAADDTLVQSVALSAAGAGGVGASGTVGVNVITSETRAYLGDNSEVNARGNAAATTVYDGTINNAVTRALPGLPAGKSGDLDVDGDGVKDGDINGGASFDASQGEGSNKAETNASAANAKDSKGNALANVTGGLGTRGTESIKGLSIGAASSEKLVTTTVGVAVGGAAGVTLGATANVVSSQTEARIGAGAQVNQTGAAGSDPSVRVKAADDTFVFMAAGTVAGGGFAGIGGSVNTAVVGKQTNASIGDADVKAGQVAVKARAEEDLFLGTANVAAGAAGVGAAVSVATVSNTTTAHIDKGATVDATGDLRITADQDTALDLYTLAGAGGVVAVSGGVSVGVVDNTTKAYVEGAATAGEAVKLDAGGSIEVGATSREALNSVTASAAAGGVGVAGSVGVKVLTSETTASIGNHTQVNQTRGSASQGVNVHASDTVALEGGGGAAAAGGFGVGAMSDTNIVRNTTTASIGSDARVAAGQDIAVNADSSKNVESTAVALAGGVTAGVGGTVSVTVIGASLDADSQEGLGNGKTANDTDSKIQNNDASEGLGDSEYLVGVKSNLNAKTGALGVKDDMNESSVSSQDKTQASVGDRAHLTAGRDVNVAATDKTQLDIEATGAGTGAIAGIGAAVGVGITNSTTEAFVGHSAVIDSQRNVTVQAAASNLNATGSRVNTTAGAGGFVGLSAAVSVLDDTSTTQAYIGESTEVQRAVTLLVNAETARKATTSTLGASGGALAVGASVSRATFAGSTEAYLQSNVQAGMAAGKLVNNVNITASDASVASASAKAGAAGILAGSGADAQARVDTGVSAYIGSGSDVDAENDVDVKATSTASTKADAIGVTVGAGGVGASLATAHTGSTTQARVDGDVSVTGATLDVVAQRLVGTAPTTSATAFGASGGLLFGINATKAVAESTGATTASLGNNSTFSIDGATKVHADSNTQQVSSGVGISVGGLLAVGADYSEARSSTTTVSSVGDGVKLTGASLDVLADSSDANFAHGIAGSGGLVSAPFSESKTVSSSVTRASTGSGDNVGGDGRKIDVGAFAMRSSYDNLFDAWMQSTNASLIGVSGAKATNTSHATTSSTVGANGYVESGSVSVQASNIIEKGGPASGVLPGVTSVTGSTIAVPSWNVNSSSGGLADVPAADSLTTITNSAVAEVGAGATVKQTGSMMAPGAYKFDAWNDVKAKDRVKMASGGAVSAASGSSKVLADSNVAKVKVGDGASLSSTGDLMMGARSIADISTQTSVDVWGLVGVAPKGDSVSRFKASNSIEIGAATLEAQNDIRLNAGASTLYNPEAGLNTGLNSGSVVARTDVFNNTAIPVNRDPVADAIIQTDSQITIADGAILNSVSDVALFAEKGNASASGVGIGKDVYREALAAVGSAISNAFGGGDVSFETRTGNSVKTQTSSVTVDGEVHVGTHRKQNLEIDINGDVVSQTDGIRIESTGVASLAQDILDRIDALNELIRQYSGSGAGTDAAIAVAAYQSEIRFLERKLVELGFEPDPQGGGFAGVATLSQKAAAQEAVTAMTATKSTLASDKTALTTQNTQLGNANTTLTTTNSNLVTANNNLTSANTTLAGEVATLTTQLNAADPDDKPAIQAQINAKNNQIAANNNTKASNTSTINANNSTISANNNTISANETEITSLTTRIDSLTTQIDTLQTALVNYSDVPQAGPSAKFLTISDAEAKLGNIYVRADKLQGHGVLDAPGDAEIRITNNGPSFLILNDLTIPADEGGRIYHNSVDVKNNAQINGINGASGGASFDIFTADSTTDFSGSTALPGKPKILVESKYDPLDPFYSSQTLANGAGEVAPDIILRGDISNLRGLVKIESAAGSIRIEETASIQGDDVEVKTRNGDFVQSYSNTFSHVAGAPLTTTNGNPNLNFPDNIAEISRTPEAVGKGIVANGSVLIAARYLNINGTVQSGIPEWGVRIPASASVNVGGVAMSFAEAQAHYNGLTADQKAVLGSEYFQVSGATVAGLSGNEQGAWEDIKVSYNAKENRLELSGVRVQGGYIELFGQIFNTNQVGGGNLRVMDGYGQIKVENESTLPMWVNLLDTGKGVQGEINITNISGVDANGVPIISTTSFLRGAGGSRNAFYDPQQGLRYTMTVGYDEGRVDYYRYSQNGWFGGAILGDKALDQFRIDSRVRSNDPLSQAEYLQVVGGSNTAVYSPTSAAVYTSGSGGADGTITGGDQESVATADPVVTPGRSWRDCNWWTLCANATHYQEFTVTTATKTTITESVKADQRIGIEFIGFDQGTVNVASVGDVVINGAINNASGDTTVSSGGSISQNGDLNVLTGKNVFLSAGSGIGSGTQAVQINISDLGRLDATSAAGEVHVKEMVGDLNVGSIGGAGVSNVVIEADKNIVAFDQATSYIQGQRVELLSNNGGIGAAGTPLNVRTGYTTHISDWPNNGLLATARESINIRNLADAANPTIYNGNLLLISAESKAGDVRIETSGAVIDNNPFETTDTRTEAELANLWDELRLRGAASVVKADEAVAQFVSGKENNYHQYWLLRGRQADGGALFNPDGANVTPDERNTLLQSGMSDAEIDALQDQRSTYYQGLHAEVGGLTTSYVSNYAYDAVATGEAAQIREGATWSDAQLQLSIGAGLLKNITDTVTTIKEPNVKGNNIELVAGTSIGSMNPNVEIVLPVNATPDQIKAYLDALTQDQKAALAAAERGDATLTGNTITIIRPRAVNVETGSGSLTASAASGDAFIGSEEDLSIHSVSATDNIRIKTAGSLINAATVAGGVNVSGANIILESANGGIGAIPDPTTGLLSSPLVINHGVNSSLIARAAGDVWIQTPQSLRVDTIFSRKDVKLDAFGSILDMPGDSAIEPQLNIRSHNITLEARTGSIGEDDNALDVGVNPDGRIEAKAEAPGAGVYLHGPTGENFNIGSSVSGGATELSAANNMKVDGSVTGPGRISLIAGGISTLTTQADVHSSLLGVSVRAGSLVMEDDGTDAARVRSDAGTIDIESTGDASVTGVETGNGTDGAVRIVSTAGRVLDAGDTRFDVIADALPAAKLTLDGKLGVGSDGNALDVRVRSLLAGSSDGSVAVSVDGNVNIEAVTAGDAVDLTASGDITGNSVSSTGAGSGSDQSVTVTSTGGGVQLAVISGLKEVTVDGRKGVKTGSVNSRDGSVSINTDEGDIEADTTSAGQNVTMTAGLGRITAGTTTAVRGDVTMRAYGDIDAGQVSAGGSVVLDSVIGALNVESLTTRRGLIMETRGDIRTGSITAAGDVELTSSGGLVNAENTRSTGGSVSLEGQRDVTAGRVDAASDIGLASARGAIDAGSLLARRGSIELDAERDVDVESGAALTGTILATSRRGSVRAGTLSADAVSLSAPGAVAARTLNVGSRMDLAGSTVNAGINSTGLGDVGGSVTGFGGGMASDVQLALNSPFAFHLSTVAASTGNISISDGDLFVDRLWVGNRMTVSNPFTRALIDQSDRSVQPFDVQLYSAGEPFAFGLTRNRVFTDAFVVARERTHEVISPLGNNLSAVELGEREISLLWSMDAPTDDVWLGAGWLSRGFGTQPYALVSFEGTPVDTEEACEASSGQGSTLSGNAQCDENKQ